MKILVIQNRMGIGDMIMFLPFIKAISNYYGEQVSLMVKKSTKASEYLNCLMVYKILLNLILKSDPKFQFPPLHFLLQ